jgi:hypothetical protein
LSESLPAETSATTVQPSAEILPFNETARVARQLLAMLGDADDVTLFHHDDDGMPGGIITKPVAEVAAAIREAVALAGGRHVFASITGIRFAYRHEEDARRDAGDFVPTCAMHGPQGSIHLVCLTEKPDDLLPAVQKAFDDGHVAGPDAYVALDVPLPYGDYRLTEMSETILREEGAFEPVTAEEVRDAFIFGVVDGAPVGAPSAEWTLNDATVTGDIAADILDTVIQISTAKKREGKPVKGALSQSFFDQSGEITFGDFLKSNLTKVRRGDKNGRCFIPASLKDGRRNASAATALYMLVLDVDSGAGMDETIAKLQSMGLFFISYTTHSHGSRSIEIKKDRLLKWAGAEWRDPEITTALVRDFLTDERKYVADVIESAEYVDTTHETTGIQVNVRTRAIDKFRLVFVLDKPFSITNFHGSQKQAQTTWGDMILGMGAALGIKVDRACRDVARLYYLPSADPAATNARIVVNAGRDGSSELATPTGALDWTKIKPVPLGEYNATSNDAFDRAAAVMGSKGNGSRPVSPGGEDLMSWAGKRAHGFQISQVFKDHCDDRLRKETAPGKYTCECPFDDEHSNAGDPKDPGCFILDAGMDAESFQFRCSHDSCSGRDRLDMLQKAMADEWFTDEVLTDPAYDVAGVDEDDGEDEGQESEASADDGDMEGGSAAPAKLDKVMDLASKATLNMKKGQITAILKKCIGLDEFDRKRILTLLTQKTKMPMKQLDSLYKTLELRASPTVNDAVYDPAKNAAEVKKRYSSLRKEKRPIVILNDDHQVAVLKHTLKELQRANEGDKEAGLAPAHKLFRFGGNPTRVSEDESGRRRFDDLTHAVIGDVARKLLFVGKMQDSNSIAEQLIPEWLAKALVATEDLKLLPLAGVIGHPLFDKEGNLHLDPGYDPISTRIMNADGLDMSKVKERYQDVEWTDVEKAVAALDHAFGNVNWLSHGDDENASGDGSRATYYACLIAPFIREVLGKSNQMLFGIDKADPGMGGTLLAECANVIWTGERPQMVLWPKGRDAEAEVEKRTVGVLKRVPSALVFDNVHGVIGGTMIPAMATGFVLLRVLGGNEMFEGELRIPVIFVGNNLAWSDENARRVLVARIGSPVKTMGDDGIERFNVEGNLADYLKERRSEYVGHLITIIQWWFKQGCPKAARNVESFEDFVSIMGGILGAAGIDGWLDGWDAFLAEAKRDQSDEIGILQALGDKFGVDKEFSIEQAVPELFKDMEGGGSPYTRYEARFETLAFCIQNGAVGTLSLAKHLGWLKGKPREIVVDGKVVKVKLTKLKSNGERRWMVWKVK